MTPLMRQYWDIKALHQDKVLLFRMGDFFEMFFDDAVTAAPILGIALTQRNKKSADETPMCGVPHHSIAGPINKLLAAGLKVAICDQLEDPKQAKGIVKRGVTRVLTPGMVYDPETLEPQSAHYMACFDDEVLACVDTTTGEAFYFANLSALEFKRLTQVLPIAELVVAPEKQSDKRPEFNRLISYHDGLVAGNEPNAVRRLRAYLQSLGTGEVPKNIGDFIEKNLKARLDLSPTVIRHLEVFSTYKGEGAGSLFHAIDRTRTFAGARLLRSWLQFPLIEQKEIIARQNHVEWWRTNPGPLKIFRDLLTGMGDLERRMGKITLAQSHARDLLSLAESITVGLKALRVIENQFPADKAERLERLATKIVNTFVEEPPLSTTQGYMIRQGVLPLLDEYIELSTNSQGLLQQMEEREKAATGIPSLKIRYNNVFGYYIEITNTHKDKAPKHYMRKQTLTNAERYTTDELVELEKKVLSAQAKRSDLEKEIYEQMKNEALSVAGDILSLAHDLSERDVFSSLAWLAIEKRYVRPQFTNEGTSLKASRHPVVEQTVKKSFVPNNIEITQGGCLLLTGPNMAGKSTIMRQVALTAILAQIGSFVPADEARLPVFEHLFTRIGASDQLSEGLSTFMVEMIETAEMLEKSTAKSLIILDEIGRGTSTFDGMSLAQSILEHILQKVCATTLFATHYHELTGLSQLYPQLHNGHMTVTERGGEIRFLHTLVSGPAQKSYGIQVAKLAGLPSEVTTRAAQLLKEKENKAPSGQMSLMDVSQQSGCDAVAETDAALGPQLEKLISEVLKFQVNSTTPLDAMMKIAQWQETLSRVERH